ncbi:unnamed protein product [Pseudo-nitzschia multistriata]|uniref:Uncharacterized protein n=1 Tax=Pseudo-nitzschia multistriata TaxID=183589 RepID=A0A448ZBZ6_9STRA|nr:unnamed protein product [Pseudo-nitzschia multistriata]
MKVVVEDEAEVGAAVGAAVGEAEGAADGAADGSSEVGVPFFCLLVGAAVGALVPFPFFKTRTALGRASFSTRIVALAKTAMKITRRMVDRNMMKLGW